MKLNLLIKNNFILFNALIFFVIFLIIICLLFLMIFSLHKTEATLLDKLKAKHIAPIMKLEDEIKPIPTFEVKNKLKTKLFDLPELKKLHALFPKLTKPKPIIFAAKTPKITTPIPKFDLFGKNKLKATPKPKAQNIFGKPKSKLGIKMFEQNCECGTDSPHNCQHEINLNTNRHIPELQEFESTFLNQNDDDESVGSGRDDNFILVDDKNFSKHDSNPKLRKWNKFLKDIGQFTLKPGITKRDIHSASGKLNLVKKLENETSIEKAQRNAKLSESLQKMMQFVTIVGQVDSFLSKKARDTIRKLAVLVDDDDSDYPRNKRY